MIEIDSFDCGSGKVLLPQKKNKLLHLASFFLKNVNLAKCNNEIYNNQLLAMNKCFKR